MTNKIIHIDMDCFYAQVEMRDRPELSSVPLAIGGPPQSRSVLCTSNYLAREFGVRSAMPSAMAMKLCPQLVILPPDFKKYKDISRMVHEVFNQYSNSVEPVSLDEAYLDVSDAPNATAIAIKIKEEIYKLTGLTASVGVAPTKFLAKIASDWNKPNGIFVIRPNEMFNFITTLPAKLIPGIGSKSNLILESLNIKTCGDLRAANPKVLNYYFGKFSEDLINYSNGIDSREVISDWERKSLSVENTFLKDLINSEDIELELDEVILEMKSRVLNYLELESGKKIKKIFIKVKYSDFKQSTTEESIELVGKEEFLTSQSLNNENFKRLLDSTLIKRKAPIRLIGVGVRFLTSKDAQGAQLNFFSLCA